MRRWGQFCKHMWLASMLSALSATPAIAEDLRQAFKRTAALVLDEADRLLEGTFEEPLKTMLQVQHRDSLQTKMPRMHTSWRSCYTSRRVRIGLIATLRTRHAVGTTEEPPPMLTTSRRGSNYLCTQSSP